MEFSLDQYYVPEKLDALVLRDNFAIPQNKFFSPENQHIREAWCAAQLGLGFDKYIGRCEVKVNSGEFPDFFLKYNGCEFEFENTEVLREGRLRTKEYREKSDSSIEHISQAEMEYNETKAPEWVKNAIEKKASKYKENAKSVNLLIYVNINSSRFDINKIREACLEYEDTFQSVWLLTGQYVGTLFMSKEGVMLGEIDGFSCINDAANGNKPFKTLFLKVF